MFIHRSRNRRLSIRIPREGKFCKRAGGMIFQNEKGFVLVAAMIMLLIVLAIGIFASRLSTTETMISGIEQNYKDNLYQAETAVFEGAQTLEDASDFDLSNPTAATVPGLTTQAQLLARPVLPLNDADADGTVSTAEIRVSPEWDPATAGALSVLTWANPARYMCVDEGYLPGENLDMSKPVTHRYMCYGKSQENNGNVTIRVEYRKKFIHE